MFTGAGGKVDRGAFAGTGGYVGSGGCGVTRLLAGRDGAAASSGEWCARRSAALGSPVPTAGTTSDHPRGRSRGDPQNSQVAAWPPFSFSQTGQI